MKKTNSFHLKLFIILIMFSIISIQNTSSQTFCTEGNSDQITGVKNGFRYELWNQDAQGTACMTIGEGALFSGEWDGVENYLARRGLSYDQTEEHQEIGVFYANYDCDYKPSSASGNSYLSVYGWTVDPLTEFYIVEDWRNWIPSMSADAIFKGTLNVNGSDYNIYENTRVNQHSILGIQTFQQYFSIRKNTRNSGIINISDHFNEWESLGMDMGKMFEVSFVVEGYKSSGTFDFTALDVFLSDTPVQITDKQSIPTYFTIYSNPNSSHVSIKLDNCISYTNILIYNTLGEVVYSKKYKGSKPIQLSNLTTGVYIVNMIANGFYTSQKFIVH